MLDILMLVILFNRLYLCYFWALLVFMIFLKSQVFQSTFSVSMKSRVGILYRDVMDSVDHSG